MAKAMLANARRRMLLADHSKFTRVTACELAELADMTTVITDSAPSNAMMKNIKDSKRELIVAGDEQG